MKEFIRNCPTCSITITYKSEKLLKQAMKRNSKCHRSCVGVLKDLSNKICLKCKKEKSKNRFGILGRNKDRLNDWCKSCMRKVGKKSYYNNKQSRSKSSKEWRARNPNHGKEYDRKNPEIVRRKNKKWREKNPGYDANYRANNKEEIKLRNQRWGLKNPSSGIRAARKYRAKKLEVNEEYSNEDNIITKKEFNYKCYNCKSNKRLTTDHHRPLSKGFPLTLTNAVILCHSCNSSKGSKNPEDFYSKQKYIRLEKKLRKIGAKYL